MIGFTICGIVLLLRLSIPGVSPQHWGIFASHIHPVQASISCLLLLTMGALLLHDENTRPSSRCDGFVKIAATSPIIRSIVRTAEECSPTHCKS